MLAYLLVPSFELVIINKSSPNNFMNPYHPKSTRIIRIRLLPVCEECWSSLVLDASQ